MKKPSSKVIAVYLIWVLVQAILLLKALPIHNESYYYIFPFTGDDDIIFPNGDYVEPTRRFLQLYKVYDLTECTFYTIAPVLIYYAVSFWNKAPKD
jgi:hypothetical protein